jgi:glycosyltransferase involved in cell wall biosynthesis
MLSIFGRLANKMYFTDPLNAERAPKFFMMDKKKLIFLAAPINTEFFVPQNKEIARKKLKFRKDEKIILYVGRANYLRCSDILIELIKNNKEYNFVIVGPIHDPELKKIKTKNLIHIEKLPQDKLLDYYAASDLVFCLNRGGGGIGISSEEALACGRPIILSNQFRAKKEKGIYQINTNYEEAQNSIKQYFSLSDKEKTNISKLVRKYAEKNYSYDIWKNKYIEAYLH